jgi:hypothetical protein
LGELLRAPHTEMKGSTRQTSIARVSGGLLGGFVYVTLAQQPATFLPETLAPLRDNVGRYDMSCYQLLRETSKSSESSPLSNLAIRRSFDPSYATPGDTENRHCSRGACR